MAAWAVAATESAARAAEGVVVERVVAVAVLGWEARAVKGLVAVGGAAFAASAAAEAVATGCG